jgi:5-methyltetrahydrofolate--homocysteine methyltransferase
MEKNSVFSLDTLRQERALRLDGAMGTQIQGFNLTEEDFRQGLPVSPTRDVKGDNECLNLTRPDVISSIHHSYVEAGADIIETNSFGANTMVQQDYGLSSIARDMAFAAARLAREAADAAPRKVWVAGSMGPGSKSLSLVADFTRPEWRPCSFDEVAAAYAGQARALIEGGVDLIIIETCFDALNAKAALYGVQQVRPGFPVIVSVSVSGGGRVLTGQSLEAFFTAVSHAPLAAFGLNCSMGIEGLIPLVRSLGSWCPVPLVCYPNAGLPNAQGGYDESPEEMACHIQGLDGEVNLYGGCCGTSPEHIHALPSLRARMVPTCEKCLVLSGLEMWNFGDGPITVSAAANVGKSADFAGMMERGEYEDALYAVSDQLATEGASLLEVNLDGLPDTPAVMERFIRLIQSDPSVSSAALLIESSDMETLIQGLKNTQGKSLAGPLDPRDAGFVDKAATLRSLGAALLVKACDDHDRVLQALAAIGIPPQDVVFEDILRVS